MKRRRRMLLLPSLLLLLAAALCLAPRRVEVRTELLHWQTDDPAVSGLCPAALTGTLYRRPFRGDVFRGTLSVAGLTEGWGTERCLIAFDGSCGKSAGSLYLLRGEDAAPQATLWTVVCAPDWSAFHLLFPPSGALTAFSDPESAGPAVLWSAEHSGVLSFPAGEREEARASLLALGGEIFPGLAALPE